ncbi:unnamed protein product [Pedinophyceae sp. YPF-701]|nr:unnamed protein product [Pedinophyceae sp. YPF-701]
MQQGQGEAHIPLSEQARVATAARGGDSDEAAELRAFYEKSWQAAPGEARAPLPRSIHHMGDDFCMYHYKIDMCTSTIPHDWTSCPFAHPGEKARRRNPLLCNYAGVPCPDSRKGRCQRGEACPYAHGVFECWLHPLRFRSQMCKDGPRCERPVCFFAHNLQELRVPNTAAAGGQGGHIPRPPTLPPAAVVTSTRSRTQRAPAGGAGHAPASFGAATRRVTSPPRYRPVMVDVATLAALGAGDAAPYDAISLVPSDLEALAQLSLSPQKRPAGHVAGAAGASAAWRPQDGAVPPGLTDADIEALLAAIPAGQLPGAMQDMPALLAALSAGQQHHHQAALHEQHDGAEDGEWAAAQRAEPGAPEQDAGAPSGEAARTQDAVAAADGPSRPAAAGTQPDDSGAQ